MQMELLGKIRLPWRAISLNELYSLKQSDWRKHADIVKKWKVGAAIRWIAAFHGDKYAAQFPSEGVMARWSDEKIKELLKDTHHPHFPLAGPFVFRFGSSTNGVKIDCDNQSGSSKMALDGLELCGGIKNDGPNFIHRVILEVPVKGKNASQAEIWKVLSDGGNRMVID